MIFSFRRWQCAHAHCGTTVWNLQWALCWIMWKPTLMVYWTLYSFCYLPLPVYLFSRRWNIVQVSLVFVTRPPTPTTTTAARRSSSSRRRQQQLWQLKMWNSQGRQLALKFDLQWHTMRLSSSAIYGFYLWLHFYYTVQKEALMGSSHRRCTPTCP